MSENHFEYEQISEEEEKLDFDNLVPCPNCKKPIPQDATMCFYCGQMVRSQGKSVWITWIVIVLIILLILFLLF